MRLAVIGAGGFARAKHLPAYREMPEVELVACCDVKADVLARTCDELGIAGRYTDVGAMLAGERPEIVAVVVPPPWHVPLVRKCVEAGSHVLVEKPLSEDYREIRDLLAFLEGRPQKVMVSQNYRFQLAAMGMRQAVGRLGQPYWMELTIFNPAGDHPSDPPHYKSLFVNIGVHLVDLARCFAGREVESVWAPPLAAPHALGLRYPFTEIHVSFAGGLTALVRMDWSARGLEEWIKVRLQGSEGVAVCDYNVSPDVLVSRPGEPEQRLHLDDSPDSLPRVMRHLMACIREDRQPETCVADNVKTMEIVLGAYLSCRERRVVRFPEDRELLASV